ncbi:MAG: hypothetical protein Q4F99_00160 [bacterium]|nr:hypothetical protein [bacterium]
MRTIGLFALLFSLLLTTDGLAFGRSKKNANKSKDTPPEQVVEGAIKATAADFFKDRAKEPRFRGAFEVGFYYVNFPDTYPIDLNATLKRQSDGVEEYFKKYTQGICWPICINLSSSAYQAPHPLGYYSRYHVHHNKIGWNDEGEGRKRLQELRQAAFAHARRAQSSGRKSDLPPVTAFVYATKRRPLEDLEKIKVLRDPYPKANDFYPDQLNFYSPTSTIRWADPLWPNSSVLLSENSGAGTMIHELGHVLGAPDYYHATEITGGIDGTPVTVGGGPTGPLYCRWKYCATLPDDAYRMITKDTQVTLAPRWSEYTAGSTRPLGVFIPTCHPNYLLHLEYEPSDPQALRGNSEDEVGRYSSDYSSNGGIYIYYINVTQGSSYVGHPDLCYVYRPGDPTMRGYVGGVAVFREGDAFDQESDPKNILPNQLPTGIEIEFGEQTEAGATVTIKVPRKKASGTALKRSLLPIIEMKEIEDIQPTTFSVETDLTFRGEPLAEERGIVYGTSPNPTYPRSPYIAIHGLGFDKARVVDLRPGQTIYVRAYARSKLGVAYSKQQQKIVLPRPTANTEVEPLLIDNLTADDWQTKNYSLRNAKDGSRLNGTAMIALLKMMNLRRSALDGKKPKKNEGINFNELHLNPHAGRHPPTLQGFYKARDVAERLAEALGLHAGSIPEDLEERLQKELKFPSRVVKGKEYLVNLEMGCEQEHADRIQSSLLNAWPVLCVRESSLVSHPHYAIDVCIIDGMKRGDEGMLYHIIYPTGIDRMRKTNRTTGWHPLEVLTEGTSGSGARLIFLQRETKSF